MSPMKWFRLLGLCAVFVALVVEPALTQDAAKGEKYALLVGVTKYDSKNFSDLTFCDNDAEKMAVALKKAGFVSIRALTSKRGATNEKDAPTAANIQSALKVLLDKKTQHDTVVVGLAGHGMQVEVADPEDKQPARQYSYFCPQDASLQNIKYSSGKSEQLILLDELLEKMGKSDAGHRLALIDACRNDAKAKGSKRARLDADKVTIPKGVGALFSCSSGQFAFEAKDLGHGVFFYHVIEALNGEAADSEGVVTWADVIRFTQRHVPRSVEKYFGKDGGKQVPASVGNLEGESVLVPAKQVVKPTEPQEKATQTNPIESQPKASPMSSLWQVVLGVVITLGGALVVRSILAKRAKLTRAMANVSSQLEAPVGEAEILPQTNPAKQLNPTPARQEMPKVPATLKPRTIEVVARKSRPVILKPTFTNSIGMTFVLVEPGTFLMGSPANEADRSNDEQQHEVTITTAFYVAIHPVTQGQWANVLGSNPSCFSRTGAGKDSVRHISDADLAMFPVECVSWEEAQTFLNALTALSEEAKIGRQYRLPSEAEWEYACRSGRLLQHQRDKQALPFHFAQSTSSLSSRQANFDGNYPYGGASKGEHLQRPSKVGSYNPNALGIFDMHGNVCEWCLDWYDPEYSNDSPKSDPPGPAQGSFRVLRGGSWFNYGQFCRAAYRCKIMPGFRLSYLGFRVAAVPSTGAE